MLQGGNLAQTRHGVQPRQQLAQLAEPLELHRRTGAPCGPRKRREFCPGGDVSQLVAMLDARALEGAGPPQQFLVRARGSRNLRRRNRE